MGSERTYQSLVEKFEKTKQELGEAESTIRRITGRDPDEISNGATGSSKFRQSTSAAATGRSYSGRKRPAFTPGKRNREEESPDEESPDEDDEDEEDEESPRKKHALQSTVVAKGCEARSRKATIEEQNANSKIKARNRRMFSSLIGTLEKFQHEEKKRQHKESMRAEIEQKVEAATEEERERIKREKEQLFVTRKEKKVQLRCLEKKIERAETHEIFDKNHKYMLNFILTKSKPPIFFLPSSHTSATKRCLEESRRRIQGMRDKRRDILASDLSEIDECYRKDSMPVDKENKCPKDENESQDVPETESESLVVEQEDTRSVQDDEESTSNDKTLDSLEGNFSPIYD